MIKDNTEDPWTVDTVPHLDIQAYAGDRFL